MFHRAVSGLREDIGCAGDIKVTMSTSHVAMLAVLLIVLSAQRAIQHECYVKPEAENSTIPCPSPCYTLQDYINNYVAGCEFGTSNITYIFLDGVHELFDNVSLNFFQSDSISLVGKSAEESQAEIVCYDQAGFLFKNSTNIAISYLSFIDCGHWYYYMILGGQATLAFNNVTNLTITNTTVRNSTGYGLYALCAMGYVEIVNSLFAFNKGSSDYDGGNAGFLYQSCSDSVTQSLLSIKYSHFLHGSSKHINPLATGLSIFVWSTGVNVEIDNITAIGNVAAHSSTGGNVAIFLRNRTSILSNCILVKNSYIADGYAYEGAGMYASILDTPPYDAASASFSATASVSIPEVITIVNTQFINNHARSEGGGLYVITHGEAGIFSPIGNVTVRDCVFHNNSLKSYIGGGVALHLNNHYVLSYLNHSVPQFFTSVINCTIQDNMLLVNESEIDNVFTGSSAVFIIRNPTGVLLEDCRILNNNCTGITTVWSTVLFAGDVTIANNKGSNGGGIILCDNSYMLLKANTTLVLQENRARHAGGGIYAEDSCLQSEPPCFFQLHIDIYKQPSLVDTVHVHLVNNTAMYAGSAIYGGSVGFCTLFPQFSPDLKPHGAEMFKILFDIVHPPSDLSPISSNPFQVCFCTENNTWSECSKRSIERYKYPGEELSFFALTVGQKDGSAPRTVIAKLQGNDDTSQLGELESSQDSNRNCTKFKYHVNSKLSSEVIMLSVQHLGFSVGTKDRGIARVNVTLRKCPIGFAITDSSPYKCDCVQTLKDHGITCNIQDQTIHRDHHNWIGICYYSNSSDCYFTVNKNESGSDYGIVFQKHCPYDFCIERFVDIKTGPSGSSFHGDVQCAYNRMGVLCGGCIDGYSMILGNSECRKCSNRDLSLLLLFIAAGLLLVLLLILTDLSVSSGAMSALIFYANIVQVNRAIFFGASISSTAVNLCSIFIAWLNLDFGIDVCFFDGLDAYGKTWLQFAFPLYVWGIAGVIILLGRRFPSIVGRNPVRVLATLFLLSYAKLLRTIITAFSYTELTLPLANGTTTTRRLVWREDGNVDYLQGKHIPLFIVALGFGLVTLPYAIVLFSVQWLQKHHWACFWVVRMKPLFDAYTGPYKTHCRFWTGFLLLLRVLLFVTFTFPAAGDSKLSLILVTCILVQTIAWSFRGVFESRYTDILNSVYFLNLGIFASATSYTSQGHGNQNIPIYLSVGVAFILFNSTLVYYTFLQIQATKKWRRLCVWFKHKRYIWCPHFIKKRRSKKCLNTGSNGEEENPGVTHSSIDPFDIHYREPLVSSESSFYGT